MNAKRFKQIESRAYPVDLIKGEIVEQWNGGFTIKVIAPVRFARKWPTVSSFYFEEIDDHARDPE